MSTSHHTTKPHHEHGTTRSYVIGFILSLVFTFIPYYLVVNHVLTGLMLLIVILGIGVIQMIIQLVFFLHLGREKKPHWQLVFLVSTVGIILVVVGGSLVIISHLHYNMTPVTATEASKKLVEGEGIAQIGGEKTGACEGQHANHKVVIKDGQVTPSHITANKCDKLIFINEDSEVREMTFGTHPDHGVYGGQSELTVRKGRAKSIPLSEPGSYQFHDHLDPSVNGRFTVGQ